MKISYIWLKSLLDINKSPQQIAELLTQAGLEVTHMTRFEFISPQLIVGKIIESKPHPNADKLLVTKVDIGQEQPLSIVCGDACASVNKTVVVAPVGTQLKTYNNEVIKIKKAKIRGEVSEGMLCSEQEIGISDQHENILLLNAQEKVGTPLEKIWKTPADTVFEIDLTPNRNDATHHLGVVRDLAAKLGRILPKEVNRSLISSDSLPMLVSIKEKKACPRYAGVVLDNLQIKPSPPWIQRNLSAVGIRPVNNVIDITNFVMCEIGQPLHAFDYHKIENKKIYVKKTPPGTHFISLDGKTYTLSGDELMICDQIEPIAMAGIIGGDRTKITEQTTTIFLESAYFDPIWVYKASKQHKIHTNASAQFSKGTDPSSPHHALQRAVALIKKYAHATIASMFVDENDPEVMLPTYIPTSYASINRLAGVDIPPKTVEAILTSLDIGVKKKNETAFTAVVKPYRRDIKRPVDIVEEVLRIYGYENLVAKDKTATTLSLLPMHTGTHTSSTLWLKKHFVSLGYHEIITNPLTSSTQSSLKDKPVMLDNPLNQELDSLRTTLLFTGLSVLKNNLNRGQQTIKFFEIGKVYTRQAFQEINKLGIWLTGYDRPITWKYPQKNMDIDTLKAIVKNLYDHVCIPFKIKEVTHPNYDICGTIQAKGGKSCGFLGKVQKSITQALGISEPVFFAEISVDTLLQPQHLPKYQPLSRYPEVTRDISIAIDKKICFAQIAEGIKSLRMPTLQHFHLIDQYEGKSLPKDKKSYTLRFTWQSTKKTLEEKDVEKVMKQVYHLFVETFGGQIRD